MHLILFLFLILPNKYELRCENQSTTINSEKLESQDYLPLRPIADFLDVNYVINNANQRLYLTGNGHQCIFIGNINTMLFDSLYQNIPFAPRYLGGEIYFPAQALIAAIARPFGKLLFINAIAEAPLIDKISVGRHGDSTVVKFSWEDPIDFDVQFAQKMAIIEIDGQYKGEFKTKGIKTIKSAKLSRYDTYTRIELDLENINSYLERKDEVVFYNKLSKKVNLIVIDPGHGGIDPGAVGKKGLYEKDINLSIAKSVKNFLVDSTNVKAMLTRENDAYLALNERTDVANRNGADLFVSIHCNSSGKDQKLQGFETYFLSEAKTDEARAAAALENAALKFDGLEPSHEISFILYDLAQNAFLQESNTFAEVIQNAAEKTLPIPTRGVSQAGFYVLHGAFMPAVLIEVAYISNLEEEKLLRQKSFKSKLAHCIFKGIKDFIADYERRLNN